MSRAIDLTGKQFGYLRVTGFAFRSKKFVNFWHCLCQCGATRVVAGNNLTSGNSKTCGCTYGIKVSRPIEHDQLTALFNYEPKSGVFTWKVKGKSYNIGDEAGYYNKDNGYIRITIKKDQYYAQVLAWFYMTGFWPPAEIDHRDTNKKNNAWSNLRLATHEQNCQNRSHAKSNKLGYKGVRRLGKRFVARIVCAGVRQNLGVFDSAIDAARAYDTAATKLHGAFARLNFGV
jgi:hypothetical protein